MNLTLRRGQKDFFPSSWKRASFHFPTQPPKRSVGRTNRTQSARNENETPTLGLGRHRSGLDGDNVDLHGSSDGNDTLRKLPLLIHMLQQSFKNTQFIVKATCVEIEVTTRFRSGACRTRTYIRLVPIKYTLAHLSCNALFLGLGFPIHFYCQMIK